MSMPHFLKKLHWQILIGMFFGVIVGCLIQVSGDNSFFAFVLSACKLIAEVFLRLLKMVIIPLVASSLFVGIAKGNSEKELGKIGVKTAIYYFFSSFLSIMVGLVFVNLMKPGVGANIPLGEAVKSDMKPPGSPFDFFVRMIPDNPIGAMAEFDMLGTLFFVIILGIFALKVSEAQRKPLVHFASSLNDIMMSMVQWIITWAPIGVFALVAKLVATTGLEVFIPLSKYVLTVSLALAFHFFVVLPLVYQFFVKANPYQYMRRMSPALLTAFSSASSAATLPLTIKCAEDLEVKGSKPIRSKVSSLVLPMGATINMDGTALYEGVAVLFIAQVMGVDLGILQQITVLMTALLVSVGAAGIPHAGLVMMVIILEAVGLPLEATGMIWAVDRVVDMARTSVNVWSDSVGAAIIDETTDLS